jgi:hypothetical protein
MRKLMEKFVNSGYRIGLEFEGVLYKTGKSLDTLALKFGPGMENTDQNPAKPRILSIMDQISEKYDVLKCNELLSRSTALYATNKKINNWIVFLFKTLAQLPYHGSLLLKESRDLENVKDRIVRGIDTHKENNAQLKIERRDARAAVEPINA